LLDRSQGTRPVSLHRRLLDANHALGLQRQHLDTFSARPGRQHHRILAQRLAQLRERLAGTARCKSHHLHAVCLALNQPRPID